MLTNQAVERIPLPHEPGEWIEIRPLSWRVAQEARRQRTAERTRDAIRQVADLGESFGALRDQLADLDRPQIVGEPADEYEIVYLLHHAIVAWSYDAEVTEENIDALDERTVGVVLDALLTRETEADRKNGGEPSTEGSVGKVRSRKSG